MVKTQQLPGQGAGFGALSSGHGRCDHLGSGVVWPHLRRESFLESFSDFVLLSPSVFGCSRCFAFPSALNPQLPPLKSCQDVGQECSDSTDQVKENGRLQRPCRVSHVAVGVSALGQVSLLSAAFFLSRSCPSLATFTPNHFVFFEDITPVFF